MIKILTNRENQIIRKKIKGLRLTQNESNILSKAIRPKLIEASKIDANNLLQKLQYNQKARSIENKIKKIILDNVKEVDSIIVCGSAVQTDYKEYNDIDVIVATKRAIAKKKKKEMAEKAEQAGKNGNLNLDIQIYSTSSIISQYPHNPSLIYQLKDSKVIYGRLGHNNNINLSSLDLKMKLDWSEGMDIHARGDEIYYSIRNALLILLLMNKKVDNFALKENMIVLLGANLVEKLKSNKASKLEKKLALSYLNLLVNYLETELKNSKWEKIEIENP